MPTATGPDGEKLELKDGAWVPVEEPTMPKIGALPGKPTEEGAAMDSAIREGMKTFAGETVANIIGLPHAVGEVVASGFGGMRAGLDSVRAAVAGEPINIGKRYEDARQHVADKSWLAKGLLAMPEPSGADVLSAVGLEPSSGIAESAGRTAADVAAVMTLRPGARATGLLKQTPDWARRQLLLARERSAPVEEAAGLLSRTGRVAGRMAEAGAEGALVGALGEDQDPLSTAAMSAGVQAAGSAALGAKGWIWKNPGKAAVSLWLGHEMYKAVAPGPQDAFESKDEVIKEMVAAYGAGALAAVAGAGRPTAPIRRALSNASRPAIASIVTQLREAAARDEPQYELVVAQMAKDPNYFGAEIRSRLERAADSEESNALISEVDQLMKTTKFKRLYDRIHRYRTGGQF